MSELLQLLQVQDLLQLFADRNWEALSQRFLGVFDKLEVSAIYRISLQEQAALDRFVKYFLFLFSEPDYVIPQRWRVGFLRSNPLISNLVALSSAGTTDACLPQVLIQSDNLAKIMTLYSARNRTSIEVTRFFDANPPAAAMWYFQYMRLFSGGLAEETAYTNLRLHQAQLDQRLDPLDVGTEGLFAYFAASYVDERSDRPLKELLNRSLQQRLARFPVNNRPEPRRIGIVTDSWSRHHPVYRNQYAMVASLRPHYHLVLIYTGQLLAGQELGLFQEVLQFSAADLSLGNLADNRFALLYFPEVGLNQNGVVLANARLAPIQVSSYGHSVSSFGAQIDYFLASEAVEEKKLLEENYSERLILLPGLGITNPPIELAPPWKSRNREVCLINCSWHAQKINFPLLQSLREIMQRSAPHQLVFRFFVGRALSKSLSYLAFERYVKNYLGAQHVEVVPPSGYDTYLQLLGEGDFALESFPFGGCNTVMDSLQVRQPIITCQSSRWYGRIGSALLRQAGLAELVTSNRREFVNKAVELVQNRNTLTQLQVKVAAVDFKALEGEGDSFRRAIDYLLENHAQLQSEPSRHPLKFTPLGKLQGLKARRSKT